MSKRSKRVLVAMSGGVDSSVAAALLRDQGFEVCGVTMKLLEGPPGVVASSRSCCAFDAARRAKRVCDMLGIPHYTVDAAHVFSETVIGDFIEEYARGRTPNPCVRCNAHVKFGFLLARARELGCEYLATGHYARIEAGRLLRGDDREKDQSYFLYPLYGSLPGRILFPCGSLVKEETRRIAASLGLPVAEQPESQDICFIGEKRYTEYLEEQRSFPAGSVITAEGTVVGTHRGIHRYTIGQRKGLGALGRRMFVREIRPDSNTVVVAPDGEPASGGVVARGIVSGPVPVRGGDRFAAMVRYRSAPKGATVTEYRRSSMTVAFDSPVPAVAPGQSIVLYAGDYVAAGGIIEKTVA